MPGGGGPDGDAMTGDGGRVVAGIAPADYRLPMVLWAADEAAARHAELLLLSAVTTPSEQYLPAADTRRAGLAHLAEAAGRARAAHPGLFVMTDVVAGAPVDVLGRAAAGAALVVVGADDQSPFAEAITGSVPGSLLTTLPCPLAVVPHTQLRGDAAAPVIVALDEAGTSQSALAFAFAAAERASRPLVVLHCVPAGKDAAGPKLTLTAFRELYRRVEVTQEVAAGDPRDILAQRSRRAALLVLGSRGHGQLASVVFGSVGRDLIRRSGCPVVVARPSAGNAPPIR
jgi:nucleotide-binding universal stress UspA family protein